MSQGRIISIVVGIMVLILAVAFLRGCREGGDPRGADERIENMSDGTGLGHPARTVLTDI